MTAGRYRFDCFLLDAGDRQLRRDGAAVELNSRYLDALALLVSEGGRLVSKDRFLDEVWRGIPVTDEALTQCIKTLRRQLGDDATAPRFIETVPKHGYRFIAAVADDDGDSAPPPPVPPGPSRPRYDWEELILLGGSGTLGAGAAGAIGGLFYGFAASAQGEAGGASAVLVLLMLTIGVAFVGGAGVSMGIAAAGLRGGRLWAGNVIGGAIGGLVIGAVVKLLGRDALELLFGHSPGDITGPLEGALLGGAVALGAWIGGRGGETLPLRRSMIGGGVAGALTGALIPTLGGRMLAGSLDLLSRGYPDSRLSLDPVGALFGENGLGPISQTVTAAMEGALFGACLIGVMVVARRSFVGLTITGKPA